MATLTGKDGKFTFGDSVGTVNVYAWEINVARDMHDDSNFGADINAREWIGGMAQITGTARCRIDSSQIPGLASMASGGTEEQAGFIATLVSSGPTPKEINFSGLVSDINLSVPKTGVATVDIAFISGATAPTFDTA